MNEVKGLLYRTGEKVILIIIYIKVKRMMDQQNSWLKGKTALVTGGAKRLGQAISISLASKGANVIIHYSKSSEEASELAKKIEQYGVNAWLVSGDLRQISEVEGIFDKALEFTSPIQILINNASIFDKSDLNSFSVDELFENIQINAISPLILAREMAKQKIEGAIINLLDTRITEYDRTHVAYHLSKKMLFDLTRMMALEFAPSIRVNAIAPGLILPPPGQDLSYLEKLASTNPLNSIGNPKEITKSVIFLLESMFITGQVIFVDGGYHMKGYTYG
jgi:NAD(P)-dependent dehydrogenase (short-subunit alcohol dehydrogenase family)